MTNPKGDTPDWLRPATYVYSKVFSGFISALGTPLSVGQWATVRVMIGNLDGTSLTSAVYQFNDSASGQVVDSGVLSANNTASSPNWPAWTLPVVADTLTIFPLSGSPFMWVVATNRILAKAMCGDFAPIRTFTGACPANPVAGTTINLTGADANTHSAIPVINCSNYNGQVMYEWRSTVAGPTGDLFADYIDASGAVASLDLGQNFSSTTTRLVGGHPFGFVKWRFVTAGTNSIGATTLSLSIVPDTPSP